MLGKAASADAKGTNNVKQIMSSADMLFPGFVERRFETSGAEIFALVGGSGPPLLLLHGYPQTHLMWNAVAPQLALHYSVVTADLRGYGRSSCPPTDLEHKPYSKRAMAHDMIEIMSELGHERFVILGHDRGARVGYRLALEHPQRVDRLALLDIIPTINYWQVGNQTTRLKMFHWAFLAQPAPLPESLIRSDPAGWVDGRLGRGAGSRTLDVFHPAALDEYRRFMSDPDRLHATCEDHRAGARIDVEHDTLDQAEGRLIRCPTIVLWGNKGPLGDLPDVLGIWRPWCVQVEGQAVESGHFIAEENPHATLAALLPFLSQDNGSAR